MRFVHFCVFFSCISTSFSKSISIQIETDDIAKVLSNLKAGMSKSQNHQNVKMNNKILEQIFQILSSEDRPFYNPYHPEDQSRYRRAKSEKIRSLIRKTADDKMERVNGKIESEITDIDEKIRPKKMKLRTLESKRKSDALMDFDNDRYFLTGLNKISEDELTEKHEEQLSPMSVKKENEGDENAQQGRSEIKDNSDVVTEKTDDRLFDKGLEISKTAHTDKPEDKVILTTEKNLEIKPNEGLLTEPTNVIDGEVLKNPEEEVSSTTEMKKDPFVNLSQSEAEAIEDLYLITQDNIGRKRFNDMKQKGIIYT